MKLLLNPLSILLLMLGGFFVYIEAIHTQAHRQQDVDTHGHVRQFCRANIEVCQRIISDLE